MGSDRSYRFKARKTAIFLGFSSSGPIVTNALALTIVHIGCALSTLNTQDWEGELKIPAGITAGAPMIMGATAGETPIVKCKPPEILTRI